MAAGEEDLRKINHAIGRCREAQRSSIQGAIRSRSNFDLQRLGEEPERMDKELWKILQIKRRGLQGPQMPLKRGTA